MAARPSPLSISWKCFGLRWDLEGIVLNAPQFRVYMLALALIVMPCFLAGQLGYHRLGAAGGRLFSKIILVLAAIGCATFTLATLYSAVTLKDPGIQGIGILLNMLLAPTLWGIAALRARRVTLWKRVWPFLMMIAPCVMFGLAVPAGFPRFAAPAVVGVFWLIFGYAVFNEAPVRGSLTRDVTDPAIARPT